MQLVDMLTRLEQGYQPTRRDWLAYLAALGTIPVLGRAASANESAPTSFQSNPFSLGVASGDPDSQGFVLWTKLATDVTQPDGGMKPETIPVTWEVASDDRFQAVVARGTAYATPQLGHSVHVELITLAPERWYFYRFRAGDATSPIGRARTMPTRDAEMPQLFRFAFASCQHYEQGYYTAYEQMAQDQLDLVFHLGDYIYEYPGADKRVRKHTGPKTTKIKTLDDYRERHMQYRSDPLLQAMHAACPWMVTWDDHEFDNNYANDIQEEQRKGLTQTPPAQFLIQRAAAYQAYYEMMPLRARSLPQGPDMMLYRQGGFGRLAEFFVLDTRQYRSDQPNQDGLKPLNEAALNPENSILGHTQRRWLDSRLVASQGQWNILAQQVMMGMVGFPIGDGEPKYSMDQWPGYAHERMALVRFLQDRKIPNPVVITGDIHSNWVNNLRVDDRQPETPIVATEFVGTSISSGGNGPKVAPMLDTLLSKNPGLVYHNRERGYVRCTVTPQRWTSDYVAVEDVLQPGGKVLTRETFVVEAGQPGAKKA